MKRAWLNRASLTGLLLALGAAMAGCSPSYPMDTLSNGSDFARRIHGIYVFVNWRASPANRPR
jgi:hypothetical protein